jgi:LAO/AO transport system kinase
MQVKPRLTVDDYIQGVLHGDRVVLGQAITLVESRLPADEILAGALLEKVLKHTGNSLRIGITGVPGVGKSTFIEAFGKHIVSQGKQLAVLTIDPSSPLTKGSILGDKTRMDDLSKNPNAFIRPTAAGSALGGIAIRSREAMLLCEAAGYDVIIVETVGVGQSEVAVKNMVDFFLLLVLAGAGDELQGIKKGIMEMADAIVVTKADGENTKAATQAQSEYQHALHLSPASSSGWTPKVVTASALTNTGIDETLKMILQYYEKIRDNGFLSTNRSQQQVAWFREYWNQLLQGDGYRYPELVKKREQLEEGVRSLTLSSYTAAQKMLVAYHDAVSGKKS